MLHPYTELRYINDQIGFGVFATKFIPKGTITWVIDDLDQVLEAGVVAELDKLRQETVRKYSYRNCFGQYVLCWDIGRYVNHSFCANCLTTAYDFDIAVTDINAGDELTNEYGLLNLDEPIECIKEEGIDRTCVRQEDVLLYYHNWDKQINDAIIHYPHVTQPLGSFLPGDVQQEVMQSIKLNQPLKSVKTLYCQS